MTNLIIGWFFGMFSMGLIVMIADPQPKPRQFPPPEVRDFGRNQDRHRFWKGQSQ